MPQLAQLPEFFWSQFFWLAVVFGILFFAIGRGMLPKIEAVVDARDAKLTEDLAAAERARAQADEAEEAYRARLEASRAEALRVTQASKEGAVRETEGRVKEVDLEIAEKTAAAERRIHEASGAAMKEIEAVAAELAQDLVAKLGGIEVTKDRASKAVKAAMHG
ncbi:F0F1 ATP synthase subunit B family protein [Sphingosinicella rhizophila]|uniref:ATP synthase subunit b n=1 Tax=Sphingosinicella rhizophila TaxID=3050082 RepID=A0ABU3QAL3_9SPHN|nr:ATPase [Sphingosinicella sp. GR2756]MDT9600450.1 ATPase [Sphingosinicella sp. GR2756]